MQFGIGTLDDFDFSGKTVLCRVDMNQPVDRTKGTLKSTARIEACAATVKELSQKGAKVVLLAHQGSDIEYQNYYTTEPHAKVLSGFIQQEVRFIPDVCGPAAIETIKGLQKGEILLLDNVRFMAEEQTLFEQKLRLSHEEQAQTLVVRKLAPLGDIYVCDAFAAAHRDQPSLCGFQQVLPSAMGRLFEREYSVLSSLMEAPERPCVFVLGGAKIADAFLMLKTVLQGGVADRVLTGGLVSNIMLAAKGANIGKGSLDFIMKSDYGEFIDKARVLYEAHKDKIILPRDLAFLDSKSTRIEKTLDAIPQNATALDIGSETAAIYTEAIMTAKTVFVNGPMGVFEQEPTELGTRTVWNALGETEARTVVGGGDSLAATAKYDKTQSISYLCTGGGALIRFLTGQELPVVKALRHAKEKFA